MIPVAQLAPLASLFGFMVGLPTLVGTYYQSWKARQETKQAREALSYSENCLEFLLDADGTTINLVPLETLHSLPKTGDILLLPGRGDSEARHAHPAAYRVSRVEYIYVRLEKRGAPAGHARLAKAVAHVEAVNA